MNPAGFTPVLRRDLLRAIRTCRIRLGLSTGDVLVLDALLSFLPCRDPGTKADRPIGSDMMLVVYASNASISDRANRMDERVLRRHIARLVDRGLLARKDSPTGKRFPIKSRGKVIDAFGLDLSPLLERAQLILDQAADIDDEAEELRGLRAQVLSVRSEILHRAEQFSQAVLDGVERAKTIMRRSTITILMARSILKELRAILRTDDSDTPPEPASSKDAPVDRAQVMMTAQKAPSVPGEESAGDGQIVRHIESRKIKTKKTTPDEPQSFQRLWTECPSLASFLPNVPRTGSEMTQSIYLAGKILAVKERTLADALGRMDLTRLLGVLDLLIERCAVIANPDAYLRKVIRNER
ncbi:replication protein C [Yangia sp. PrR004]|nr:replication protein C [Salipiger sp. PrR004]